MIYLLGASHLMAMMRACEAEPGQAHGFGDGNAPAFRRWPLRPGTLPDDLSVASIHVGHHAAHWGPRLAEMLPDGRLGVSPGLQSLLAEPARDPEARALYLCLRGEEYYFLSVECITHPFDFVLPARPDLPPEPARPLLPLEVVSARLQQALRYTLWTLAAVRKLCPTLRLVHLTPPPPAQSDAVAAWAGDSRDRDRPVHRVPTAVRLKLWTLYAGMLEQGAAALGVETLPPPRQALDALGALLPGCMEDAIHGNAAYGALVCAAMAEHLAQTPQGSH